MNFYKKTQMSSDLSISILGDGIKEVRDNNYSWDEDFNYVPYDKYSWFLRGGSNKDLKGAGIFSSSYSSGAAGDDISTRIVIVK